MMRIFIPGEVFYMVRRCCRLGDRPTPLESDDRLLVSSGVLQEPGRLPRYDLGHLVQVRRQPHFLCRGRNFHTQCDSWPATNERRDSWDQAGWPTLDLVRRPPSSIHKGCRRPVRYAPPTDPGSISRAFKVSSTMGVRGATRSGCAKGIGRRTIRSELVKSFVC